MPADWSATRVTLLLNCCVQEARKGNATSTGFKSSSWKAIKDAFNSKSGQVYDSQQIASQFKEQRKYFAAFEELRKQSGFGISDEGVITADDEVWDAYLAVASHKTAKCFRRAGLLNKDLLEEIFDGKVASGTFSLTTAVTAQVTPRILRKNPQDESSEDEDAEEHVGTKRGRQPATTTPKPPALKPPKNQAVLDRMDSLTKALNAPKPLSAALVHFNTVLGAQFCYPDKMIVLTELQKPGIPELYLSLSDCDKQQWVSDILDP